MKTLGGGKAPADPAWSYFDLVGKVDLREQGAYFNNQGTGAIFADSTAPSGWAGWYFNRE